MWKLLTSVASGRFVTSIISAIKAFISLQNNSIAARLKIIFDDIRMYSELEEKGRLCYSQVRARKPLRW